MAIADHGFIKIIIGGVIVDGLLILTFGVLRLLLVPLDLLVMLLFLGLHLLHDLVLFVMVRQQKLMYLLRKLIGDILEVIVDVLGIASGRIREIVCVEALLLLDLLSGLRAAAEKRHVVPGIDVLRLNEEALLLDLNWYHLVH